MSSISSKVRQSVVLTADGQLQGLVNTSSTSTATNLLKVNIMNIFAQSTAADAEIKIYNETGSSKTASKLVFHGKFGTAANQVESFDIAGQGIKCDNGMYVDLTNCDFCTIIGAFT